MKTWNKTLVTVAGLLSITTALYISLQNALAQSQGEFIANYYSVQHPEWPPIPGPPIDGLQTYYLSNSAVLMDDTEVDYPLLAATLAALEAEEGPPLPPGAGEGGGGGSGGGGTNSLGGISFSGDCTGTLLAPLYQGTNVVLTLTNATAGDQYDLFTATNLTATNLVFSNLTLSNVTSWTYLGRWTNATAPWIIATISNPPRFESYYAVGCTNDHDHDGLPDVYEVLAAGSHTDPYDPDTDYDGRSDYEELVEGTLPLDNTSFTPKRLAFFRFNNTNTWVGDRLQLPLATNNLKSADAWITTGVQLTNATALLKYRTVENTNDGTANINLRSGSVRFWFKPQWTSGTGPGVAARLVEVGSRGDVATNGWWSLFFNSTGNTLIFASQTNNMAETTNLTATVSFVSNNWYQVVLTYTNGAVALYTNGVLCASAAGSFAYPNLATRTNSGFTIGSDTSGTNVVKAVFEDFQTFNYPLCANVVWENFQLTQPPMVISDLRMWLKPDLSSLIFGSSNRVDTWFDASGKANHGTQTSPSSQPLFLQGSFSNRPSVYFAGAQSMTIPSGLVTGVTQAEALVFLKMTTNPPAVGGSLWLIGKASGYVYPDGNLEDGFGSSGPEKTGIPSSALDKAHIYNVLSMTNRWESRINGVVHYAKNSNTPLFASSPQIGFGDGYFNGHVGEVLMYSRVLTPMERFAAHAYLAQRFNLVTNAPSIPTNLVAFGASTDQISVSWNGNLSNTNMSFIVLRREAGDSCGTSIFLENSLSLLDPGLNPGTTYFYRVKAVNYAGESEYSPEVSATTPPSLPSIPLASLKVWLKGDSGHGGNGINCWLDQTTNGFHAYHLYNDIPAKPLWEEGVASNHSAISFYGTNAFYLPVFATGWTQGEAFLAVKATGPTNANWVGLWLFGNGNYNCYYPFTNYSIWDNFGSAGFKITPPASINLATPHLYNPLSRSNFWESRINNQLHFTTNVSTFGFWTSSPPTLGRGDTTVNTCFRGYFFELMIFNRILEQSERDVIATNYFRRRYELW